MTARVEIMGHDGEWQEVEGVATVEVHPAALIEGLRAAAATARTADRLFRQIGEAAEVARNVYAAALRRASDRPAWQSTYGPARRRR